MAKLFEPATPENLVKGILDAIGVGPGEWRIQTPKGDIVDPSQHYSCQPKKRHHNSGT